MSGQPCNPVDILDDFAKNTLPDYNIDNKSINIEDKGSTWEATYYTPAGRMDVNNLIVGGGFPIVVIDKAKCEVVSARYVADKPRRPAPVEVARRALAPTSRVSAAYAGGLPMPGSVRINPLLCYIAPIWLRARLGAGPRRTED
jgi:hypothetical protein